MNFIHPLFFRRALSGDGKDAPIPQWASSEYGAAESRYRGRMCNLPDDFLRVSYQLPLSCYCSVHIIATWLLPKNNCR